MPRYIIMFKFWIFTVSASVVGVNS